MNAIATHGAGNAWQRRVIAPIAEQLRQGITPEKIAFTLALGFMLGIFPILGSTTLLCGLAGLLLRLNQPVIQLVNFLTYPAQIALLIPFYRAGEALLGLPPAPLDIPLLVERFSADPVGSLRDFGLIALGSILVYLIAAPVVVGIGYRVLRPASRALAARIHVPAAHASPETL